MKYLFFSASFLCLVACGGETMSPEERAAYEAKCGVIEKIIAARDDTPAFSSLTPFDVPPGAGSCSVTNEILPAEDWLSKPGTLNRPAYVCTYEISPSLDPNSQTRVDFTALGRRVTDCVGGWEKLGIGGASEDGFVHSAGYQYWKTNDRGHPNPDGGYYAPISYAWVLHADPEHPKPGQRVLLYVLGK